MENVMTLFRISKFIWLSIFVNVVDKDSSLQAHHSWNIGQRTTYH